VIERIWQDVRYAGRTFVRSPGFVCIAIATIRDRRRRQRGHLQRRQRHAVAPLPYPRAGELVLVSGSNRQTAIERRRHAGELPRLARPQSQLHGNGRLSRSERDADRGDHPERRRAAIVNANFFDVLEISAARGRTFTPEDEIQGHRVRP
jgi:hypothetical protein